MADYDVVIVGSGAGGGTLAWALARGGKRVLIVERGAETIDPSLGQDERAMMVERTGYESRRTVVNGKPQGLYIGGIAGGGTSLYGAAMMRPAPDDFMPGKHYDKHLPKYLWEWPVRWEEMEPWYESAEDLYEVSANRDEPKPHIVERKSDYKRNTPPLEPINERITGAMRAQGLTPFHLPLAINWETCLRCPGCPGYACPNGARSSSLNRCIEPAVKEFGAELWTASEAVKLEHEGGKVTGLVVRRGEGEVRVTADSYVVAAGALGSPSLLMKSGISDRSDQLGRNFMYHAGALAVGLFPKPTDGSVRFIKQLGATDLYFGDYDYPHKLGYIQSLPSPGPLTVQDNAPLPLPFPLADWANERTAILSGTVEDLPDPNNRVTPTRDGGIRLTHRFGRYDLERSHYYKQRLKSLLKRAGATMVLTATSDQDDTHTAHQVGTARFGDDPETSVLDRNCRVHTTENLYVVDGSFMPTSLGVGPALTIAANALRVAAHMLGEAS